VNNVSPPARTTSLALTPLQATDLDEVFRLYSDPATWQHLPTGRHQSAEQSREFIERSMTSWTDFGLGEWAVTIGDLDLADVPANGRFVGTGGVSMTAGGVWNLGYRLSPTWWGRGFATEIAHAAVNAAADQDSSRPVTARILSNNPASAAIAARVGLALAWEGPSTAQVDEKVQGQIYADRPLSEVALAWLIGHI